MLSYKEQRNLVKFLKQLYADNELNELVFKQYITKVLSPRKQKAYIFKRKQIQFYSAKILELLHEDKLPKPRLRTKQSSLKLILNNETATTKKAS